MFRKCLVAMVALMLVVGGLFADEIKGVFKSFDQDGNKVTIKVDDKEKTFKVDPKAKVKIKSSAYVDGNLQTKEVEVPVTKILAKQKEGEKITLTLEKDVVTGSSLPAAQVKRK